MNENLRNAGILTLLFLTVLAIYFLTRQAQNGELDTYMARLGDKLITMVPEGAGRDALADTYGEFMEKVRKREVEPERVERVAAGILNASIASDSLSPQQAEALLNLTAFVPVDTVRAPRSASPAPAPPARGDWERLDKRIRTVYEFNETMAEKRKEMAPLQQSVTGTMVFRVEPDLTVTIDQELQNMLSEKAMQKVAKEIRHMEHQEIVVWRKDLQKELQVQQEKMKIELRIMQQELEKLKSMEINIVLPEIVNSLESLDTLDIPIPVNIDSIMREVEKSLEAAGEKK